jgi:hypothetical protein
MSSTPSLTILSEEQKFNGENLLSWTTNMLQFLGSKGLSGYIDGTITLPTPLTTGAPVPNPTPIYSTIPNVDEWNFHDKLAQGHIMLNCVDIWESKRQVLPKRLGILFKPNGEGVRTCVALMPKRCLTKLYMPRAQAYKITLNFFRHGKQPSIILVQARFLMKRGKE